MRAALHKLRGRHQRVEKTRTPGIHIEAKTILYPELIREDVSRRRELHIGRHRSAEQHVNLFGPRVRLAQQLLNRPLAHLAAAQPLTLKHTPFSNPYARHYPLISRVDHLAQLLIGQHVIR